MGCSVRTSGSQTLVGLAAAIGASAAWGFSAVLTKAALGAAPPFHLLAIQLLASAAVLWCAVAAARQRFSLDPGLRRLALAGLLEPGLAFSLAVPGLALTTVAQATVIGALEPALIAVIACIFLRALPDLGTALAIGAAACGVAVLILAEPHGSGSGGWTGNGLVFLATCVAAAYVVLTSRLAAGVAALPVITVQQTAGFFFSLVLLATVTLGGLERWPPHVTGTTLLLAAISGVFQYAVAFWLYLIGLKRLPVQIAGTLIALIPVFGASGGVIFLGERLNGIQWAGVAAVVCAVAFAAARRSAPALPMEST